MMTDDLVKRLRGGLPCGDVKCFERSAVGGCTCGKAADRIEKLELRSEQWKATATTIENERLVMKDRIEKLEAALLAVKLTSVDFVAVTIAVEALEGKDD